MPTGATKKSQFCKIVFSEIYFLNLFCFWVIFVHSAARVFASLCGTELFTGFSSFGIFSFASVRFEGTTAWFPQESFSSLYVLV
jgi:hypothetical protein